MVRWIERSPYLHEARVTTTDGADLYAGYIATTPGDASGRHAAGHGDRATRGGRICIMPRDTNIMPGTDNALPNNKQEALHTAHTPAEPVADDVFLCATCGERPPRPGRLHCQECLDAEWLLLRAKDPAWYERHKDYHRHG